MFDFVFYSEDGSVQASSAGYPLVLKRSLSLSITTIAPHGGGPSSGSADANYIVQHGDVVFIEPQGGATFCVGIPTDNVNEIYSIVGKKLRVIAATNYPETVSCNVFVFTMFGYGPAGTDDYVIELYDGNSSLAFSSSLPLAAMAGVVAQDGPVTGPLPISGRVAAGLSFHTLGRYFQGVEYTWWYQGMRIQGGQYTIMAYGHVSFPENPNGVWVVAPYNDWWAYDVNRSPVTFIDCSNLPVPYG